MAGDKKTSQLPLMEPEELLSSDMVLVLDKSATTGEGSGSGGTLKEMPASGVTSFTTVKGKVHNLNLTGIDTTKEILTWAADAINAYGPYTTPRGQDFYFRSYQAEIGPQDNNNRVVITYFKLLSGVLTAGGPGATVYPSQLVISGGPYYVNPETNADLFLEIGDAGAGPVHTYFNLGEDHAGGDPWVITDELFFTGKLDGDPAIWLFLAGPGSYGGTSGNNTTAADFLNLSVQEPDMLTYNTVVHPIDLRDVDTTQTELKIIYDAVTSRGPFTALANQQMIFQTRLLENGDMVTRNYRLLNNVTKVGTGVSIVGAQLKFMCDGASKTIAITDSNLVDLDYIGATPVAAAFNVGKPDGEGGYGPWDMGVYRFIRAEDTDGVKFYSWVGLETLYGGDELGSNPEIHEAVDADFFNLTDQPTIPSTQNFLFYEDIAAMLAGQPYQGLQTLLEVADASADTSLTFAPGVTDKQAYYRFLGTAAPGLGAYILVSAPNAGDGQVGERPRDRPRHRYLCRCRRLNCRPRKPIRGRAVLRNRCQRFYHCNKRWRFGALFRHYQW